MIIRVAERSDLGAVTTIYAVEVLEGTASFETTPPDGREIEYRYREVQGAGLPYLVADLDGNIAGFAYARPYHTRPAYHLTVENSVYVARHHQRSGVGLLLLDEMIRRTMAAGKRQMVAVIGDSANQGSIRLHEKAGFRLVGRLEHVGFKFGRFLDTVIMQRSLEDDRTTG